MFCAAIGIGGFPAISRAVAANAAREFSTLAFANAIIFPLSPRTAPFSPGLTPERHLNPYDLESLAAICDCEACLAKLSSTLCGWLHPIGLWIRELSHGLSEVAILRSECDPRSAIRNPAILDLSGCDPRCDPFWAKSAIPRTAPFKSCDPKRDPKCDPDPAIPCLRFVCDPGLSTARTDTNIFPGPREKNIFVQETHSRTVGLSCAPYFPGWPATRGLRITSGLRIASGLARNAD